jgi:hypothetical protein
LTRSSLSNSAELNLTNYAQKSKSPRFPLIVFYRTRSGSGPAYYTSVATTLRVVQDVITNIPNKATFINTCRKRSVFSDEDLGKQWDYNLTRRPFIVNFLYTHSFPKRPNLKQLTDAHVITEAPRGFEALTNAGFDQLLELAHADKSLIID